MQPDPLDPNRRPPSAESVDTFPRSPLATALSVDDAARLLKNLWQDRLIDGLMCPLHPQDNLDSANRSMKLGSAGDDLVNKFLGYVRSDSAEDCPEMRFDLRLVRMSVVSPPDGFVDLPEVGSWFFYYHPSAKQRGFVDLVAVTPSSDASSSVSCPDGPSILEQVRSYRNLPKVSWQEAIRGKESCCPEETSSRLTLRELTVRLQHLVNARQINAIVSLDLPDADTPEPQHSPCFGQINQNVVGWHLDRIARSDQDQGAKWWTLTVRTFVLSAVGPDAHLRVACLAPADVAEDDLTPSNFPKDEHGNLSDTVLMRATPNVLAEALRALLAAEKLDFVSVPQIGTPYTAALQGTVDQYGEAVSPQVALEGFIRALMVGRPGLMEWNLRLQPCSTDMPGVLGGSGGTVEPLDDSQRWKPIGSYRAVITSSS